MVAYLLNEILLLVYKKTWPNLADTMFHTCRVKGVTLMSTYCMIQCIQSSTASKQTDDNISHNRVSSHKEQLQLGKGQEKIF